MNQKVRLKVNGTDHELDIPARRLLVDCIRYDIGLTGTKESCSVGVCGACAVLVDGEMYASCITLAASVDCAEITTIEGIAEDGNLHPIQQAFIDHGGFQCGICTPGQIIATKSLLEENPSPTEDEIKDYGFGFIENLVIIKRGDVVYAKFDINNDGVYNLYHYGNSIEVDLKHTAVTYSPDGFEEYCIQLDKIDDVREGLKATLARIFKREGWLAGGAFMQ